MDFLWGMDRHKYYSLINDAFSLSVSSIIFTPFSFAYCISPRKSSLTLGHWLNSIGSVLLSVGITVIGDAVAKPEYYTIVVKRIQIVYMLGSVAFGGVPGIIADRMGSYWPAYGLMTIFAVGAMGLIRPVLCAAADIRQKC